MTGKRTLRVVLAALSLALLATGAAQGGGVRTHYIFRGHLLATPPANATSISLTVEGGNRIALKKMLGSSVDQTFAVGTGTEFLRWSHGVPTVVHSSDLRAGDWIVVNVRAPHDASLSQIESRPAGIVSDRVAKPNRPTYPLFLFRGRLAAPAGTSTVTVDVRGGNRRALRLVLGNTASAVVHLRPRDDLPALAGQGADGDLPGRPHPGRPDHRPHPRPVAIDARAGRVDAGRTRRRARAGEHDHHRLRLEGKRGGRRRSGLHAFYAVLTRFGPRT